VGSAVVDLKRSRAKVDHDPTNQISDDPSQILGKGVADLGDVLGALPKVAEDLSHGLMDLLAGHPEAVLEDLEAVFGDFPGLSGFISAITGGSGALDLLDLSNYFGNFEQFLSGNVDFGSGGFNPVAAVEQFIADRLGPSGLVAMLEGGSLPLGIIPQLGENQLQGLMDVLAAGYGAATGLTLPQLQDVIASIPGAQQVLDAIGLAFNPGGSGFSPTAITGYLTAIPQENVVGLIDALASGGIDFVNLGLALFGLPGLDETGFTAASANLMDFLDNPNLTPGSGFDPIAAAQSFATNRLLPTNLFANWPDLLLELTGTTATNPLTALGSALRDGLFAPIPTWRLPLIPYTSIGDTQPNFLLNSQFVGAASIQGGGFYTWDHTVYRTADTNTADSGSAKVVANGTLRVLRSNPIPVAAAQKLQIGADLAWTGLTAGANPIQIGVEDNNGLATVIDTVALPGTTTNDWAAPPAGAHFDTLTGQYTVPSGVSSIVIRLIVNTTATAGNIWFGDATEQQIQPLNPSWILDLVPKIQNLDLSGLFDASQLKNLANIPAILQSSISGLPGALAALLPLTGAGASYQTLLDTLGAASPGLGSLLAVGNRLNFLNSSGLFDASQLTNTANIPLLALTSISGLPSALGALLPISGTGTSYQTLLDTLAAATSGGGTLTTVGNRLAALLPTSWFTANTMGGSNLVLDGGLENTSIQRGITTGVALSTEDKHSGARSMKFSVVSNLQADQRTWSLLPVSASTSFDPATGFRVQPGEKYYVEMWVRGKATNTGNGGMGVWNYFSNSVSGAEDWNTGQAFTNGTGSAGGFGWTKASGYATVPAGMDRWIPYVYSATGGAVAGDIYYVDDALVREETAAQTTREGLFQVLTGTAQNNVLLADVLTALQSFPGSFVTGYGGPGTAPDTWQATWDQMVGAGTGVIGGSGSTLADVFNVLYKNASDAAQGPMAFNLFGGLNNTRAMWRGRLPSSDASLPLSSLLFAKNTSGVPTAPTFAITQAGGAHTTWHILQQDATKNIVQWRGHFTGTITDFRARILKMDPTNGTVTPQQVSGNLVGQLGSTAGTYSTWTLATPFVGAAGDIIGIELQPIGSGTFNAVGDQTWDTVDHPTVFPRRLASIRSGSGTTTTLGSAYTHLTGFAYTDKLAAIEFAISTGNPPAPHAPALLNTTGTGAGTYPVPDWCNEVQLVAFSGGGKGADNITTTAGVYGDGGHAHAPVTLDLIRGTHFTTGAIIDFNVGAGSTGSGGGATTTGITTGAVGGAHTISCAGGTDGSGVGFGQDPTGDSPGDTTVDTVPYRGGQAQGSANAAGNVPGGAGAGGGYFHSGGNGAMGRVYIRLKQ
jgi:hypothetical protein